MGGDKVNATDKHWEKGSCIYSGKNEIIKIKIQKRAPVKETKVIEKSHEKEKTGAKQRVDRFCFFGISKCQRRRREKDRCEEHIRFLTLSIEQCKIMFAIIYIKADYFYNNKHKDQ